MNLFNKKPITEEEQKQIYLKDFIDMISPSVVKFFPSYYVMGNTYRRVFAIRNYQLETDRMALLRKFGETNNITLKIYFNKIGRNEYENLVENNVKKNVSDTTENQFIKRTKANQNLSITEKLVEQLNYDQNESMFAVTVFIEVIGNSIEEMNELTNVVITRLSGITYDNLFLRQKLGFMAVNPSSNNYLDVQFQRHMPSSSLANLFPLSYSGMLDKEGFPLGKDRHGGNIIIDFNKRNKTHTNSNIIILGNSGEGKSYLIKLIKINLRLKKNKIICLDPEHEYEYLTKKMKGTFIDLMDGQYIINVLEPKSFNNGDDISQEGETDFVPAFGKKTVLSQHISFLRDFFRTYKNFDDELLDALEILLEKTYLKFGITYTCDLSDRTSKDYPILTDLYQMIEEEFKNYKELKYALYTEDMLRKLLLGLNSICNGADSKFFNGHTNIKNHDFITFGVKNLLEASSNLKNAMLFNVLTYMTSKLLVEGNTTAILDEFYLFLDNRIMVMYVRNYMKRVRKRDSSLIIASQNIEDYLQKDIAELTKPLFAIPTYKFLFFPGSIDKKEYTYLLNLTESEYNLIKAPERGNCLFISANNKYNLQVKAPTHKEKLFGNVGGR